MLAQVGLADLGRLRILWRRSLAAEASLTISSAAEGYPCIECGSSLHERRGVEVGNIFKLGTKYTKALGANYLDKNGKSHPVIMGSYGIGSGRMLACVTEEHHDDKGIIWPITVAPYHVHIVALKDVQEEAEKFYNDLQTAGLEVLYDDREETPGVKFNDADLIGIPIRITVGQKSLKDGNVEIKLRKAEERELVPVEDLVDRVLALKAELEVEIAAGVVELPFKAE